MQRRETRADTQGSTAEIRAGGWKDRGTGTVLLDRILQPQQVVPGRRKYDGAIERVTLRPEDAGLARRAVGTVAGEVTAV